MVWSCASFFFNDTATTEIYTLSLHDALPILKGRRLCRPVGLSDGFQFLSKCADRLLDGYHAFETPLPKPANDKTRNRSEEHTSELQSRQYLVCRLLLEKKIEI